jgi:MATE family multidrug resistance protein
MSAPAPSKVPEAAATLAPVSTWRSEARAQLRLALPVIVLQVGLMLMGVVDTAMMGRVSEVEMSAVGIGHAWHFMALSFGLGVLQVLDPFVSQAFGARDEPAISRAMQRGLLLALLLSLPCSAVILCARPALEAFGQPDNIVPSAVRFCRVSVVGVPGFLLFVALRQSLQAQHRLRPLVLTIVVANLLNAGLDWVLIFGHLGAPALGAVGCAWATAASRLAQVGLLFFFGGALLTPHLRPLRKSALQVGPLLRMLKVGLPIGVQFALEIGAFNIVSLLMGRLGAEPSRLGPATVSENPASAAVGGHMVALNLAALAFMVPLGMSMAASVRVGNAIGRGDPPATRRAARIALQQALLFMAVTSAAFLLFPEALARAYTDSAGTVAVAVTLIPLAGVFGMFDGLQVVAGGCLRGTADTRFAMIAHLLGFWAFGIPLGWWLAFRGGYGPAGLWWGLVAGLAAVAVVLYARVRWRLAGVLERLRVEDHEQELLA